MAFASIELVNKMFDNTNLLDLECNDIWFKRLLGLADHTPFECVGKFEEVRIMFHILK